ncbi:MAG: hypothetical protein H0W07_07575 [Chloroflexi bacterium]|nr:hypothetical protein [Chloroflexota bacterium]
MDPQTRAARDAGPPVPEAGTQGDSAATAKAEFRALIAEKGHAVDVARRAVERLERAFDDGDIERTPFIDQAVRDLQQAVEHDDGQKLGGKSAEASRFILKAIDRMLDGA